MGKHQFRTSAKSALHHTFLAICAAAMIAIPIAFSGCAGNDSQTPQEAAAQDGEYSVDVKLEGGSGRASINSPCTVTVENGQATALIEWSSSHYDLMVVDGQEYTPVNTSGNSQFQIPIPSMDCELQASAETTAMSQPHMIDYTLTFGAGTGEDNDVDAEEDASGSTTLVRDFRNPDLGCNMEPTSSDEIQYATEFTIDRYEDGLALICTADESRYLVVPEGKEAPSGLSEDIAIIQQPVSNAYLAAASFYCLADSLGCTNDFSLCAINADDCTVDGFRKAIEDGTVEFGGKYNAPDFERIAATGCNLAIESTMINHSPKTKRQLEDLGVTVLTELSSYESDPRGRLEWIRVMGLIFDKEDKAAEVLQKQTAQIDEVSQMDPTNKTVAFFYMNSNGSAVVRKSGDYVPRMIQMAGGTYAFGDLDDGTATATATLDMESFFATAKDADIIIYNTSIDGSVASIDDLIAKNKLFSQFKAVENGDVWITGQDMYQQMVHTGDVVSDMHKAFSGNENGLTFLQKIS